MEKCSIVIPCYNEEEAIPVFYQAVEPVINRLPQLEFELIFIDDGSSDDTLSVLRDLQSKDARVHYISFSRNFGKEAGIYAGLCHAAGDYVAVMDADLQDPPELLPEMYQKLKQKECDCAAARRVDRKGEPRLRSSLARQFYQIMNKISDVELVDGARDYRMMNRRMTDAVLEMKEYNRFSKGIFGWVGFQTCWLDYENKERAAGETKWSFWKLFRYSVEGIAAFTTAPLALASVTGAILCLLSLLMVLFVVIRALLFGDPVAGWPSLACIILFLGGIQLLCMGILGVYLSRTYLETKKRPAYLVKEEK